MPNPTVRNRPAPVTPPTPRLHPILLLLVGTVLGAPGARPAVPPAEQWLPPETLAYATVPSMAEARRQARVQAPFTAWQDPALKPFRERFEAKLGSELLDPLARVTGLHAGHLLGLAEGQVTVALLPPPEGAPPGSPNHPVLLLDAGVRGPELAKAHADARAHLARSQPQAPPAEFGWRDRVVTRVSIPAAAIDRVLEAAFPRLADTPAPPEGPAWNLHTTLVDSTLVATTDPKVMAAILERLLPAPAPAGPPVALAATVAAPTGTVIHGWVNAPAVLRQWTQHPPPFLAGLARSGIALPRALDALGLLSLRHAAFAVRADADGWWNEISLAAPAAGRKGVLAFLQVAPADASPPAWVPDDVLTFRRARLASRPAWNALERLLRELDPAFLGVLQLFTEYAGRTEDPDFDFGKGFLDRLGDDWMALTFRPGTNSWSAGDLIVHASPQAPAILDALRGIASPTYLSTFLPLDAPPPQRVDREVAGGRQVSLSMSNAPWADGGVETLDLGRQRDLVALARSPRVMAAFLSNAAPAAVARPLARHPAVVAALARLGGAQGGWFEYSSERRSVEGTLHLIARSEEPLQDLFRWAALSEAATRLIAGAGSWLDFSALPAEPDRLARHFSIRVQTGQAQAEGIRRVTYRPRVPAPPPPTPPPTPTSVPAPVPATGSTNPAARPAANPAPSNAPPAAVPAPGSVPSPAPASPGAAASAPAPAPAPAVPVRPAVPASPPPSPPTSAGTSTASNAVPPPPPGNPVPAPNPAR